MSLRLPLLVLIALALPLSAQKTKSSRNAASNVTLRLVANEVPEGQGKVFLQSADSKSAELDLPTSALSEPIEMSARSLVLKAADKGVPLCTITLPVEGKSFAVLLAPGKPDGYVPFVVRADDPAFKAGDLFFINHSPKTVVLKLGGTELVLDAGKTVKSRPSKPVDNAYYDIVISERGATGDKTITSSRWPVDEHLRSYVFFTTNAEGRTTYRAIDEFLDPAGAKKKR